MERLLEDKKNALAAEGEQAEEKAVFKEAFHETYGETLAPVAASPVAPATPLPQAAKPAANAAYIRQMEALKTKAREEQLQDLVTVAMTRGVKAAADMAREATPWLMDELHDRLQDRYYQQLVELKKLKML